MKYQSHNQNKIQFDPLHAEIESVIRITNTQLEIWMDCLIGGNNANKAYNLSYSIKFIGSLSFEALEHAVNTIVLRHESLRASFSSDGIFMNIYKDLLTEISQNDISQLETAEKEKAKETIIYEEVNSLFDLVNGPLFKVKLIKIENLENILVITHHHIIGDGLSINIILEELSLLYSAYIENTIPNLKSPGTFSEYAEKVNSLIEYNEYEQIEDFWLNIYKESVPLIDLPIDYSRPPLRTYNNERFDFPVESDLINELKHLGNSAGCSIATTLLAAFEVFLYKLTGQNDLVVGFPVSGNWRYGMKHMIGDCANLLPLRSKIDKNISFLDYLKQRNPQLVEAYKHHQVSFGHLLQKLAIARDPSRVPMVPVTLTVDLNRDIENEFSFTGLTYEFNINPRKYSAFEIKMHACIANKKPTLQCSYNSSIFKEETINQMMISFEETLHKLVAKPDFPVTDLIKSDYLPDYSTLNDTETSYPNVALIELLNRQVASTPNNVALEFHDSKTTYVELHNKVNQLSHYLKAQGVQSGDFIAVSFTRCRELLYTLLAILQCGAAYLPLDPEYPKSRLEFMLIDSSAKVLLTSKTLSGVLPLWPHTLYIEDAMDALSYYSTMPLPFSVSPDDLAYILYTSGSTGNPKGVAISHKNLVNFLHSMALEPGISEKDRLLSITTISFDIAGLELYLPLIKGATLILADHETARDGRLLLELIKKENINFLQATPTTWLMLLDSGWSQPLPLKALCGGEAMPADLAKELLAKCDTLWNVYGPTETTIWSSIKQIKEDDSLITIGKPIANTQLYIIDDHGLLVAPGKTGEIAIGGDGVAKGYWNRPELTAEKFTVNKFSDNNDEILYRTGDLGKLLPNNEIECLGRVDQQVKIRGHRIEPGEIEQALLLLEGIKYAVVLANENFLVAHIVPDSSIENAEIQIPLWRETLSSQLPAQLVPHDFNLLDKMPTTLNGKIDRNELSKYKTNKKLKFTAPRTEEEKIVASIWKEVLNIDDIDVLSNFFEMGGHSVIAVKAMNKLEQKTGKRLPLSTLFEYSNIEKFAKLLNPDKEIYADCLVPIKPTGQKSPLFIIHGAGLNVLNFVNMSKYFDEDQPIYGIQGTAKRYDEWYESIEAMAAHYVEAVVKINPEGPYALAGFSFGGIVAFEMTRQLKELGKKVTLTALLDSYVDSSYYYETYRQKKLVRYKEMVLSWKAFKMRVNEKKYILKKFFGRNSTMIEQKVLTLEELIEIDGKVKKIIDRYHLKPQDFKVDLFRSKDDMSYKLDPTHLGWKKAALKGITVHNIPGNHYDIVAPPNDKVLARLLQNILDEKNADS
ncbi:non-ribosomal peptide synthetase [Flavobacterium aquicola]|uniref:Amino acid adenylation domain-containing protein n=1 Tax=Flavobacterium aquicola TaxID=1682742 RepID=A0A3E0EUJ9_9FLAO|nr:non-ribosomal peptide synthetase [Flavobacterium aquicola]REH01872.1 amino acid adenylation domain-containing protein [Flavobacterium aquicola]